MKPTASSLCSVAIVIFFILLTQPIFSANSSSPERIYIHFDKIFYSSGENIWYKIYLVDAINNKPNTLSSVVYVDLIDPNNTIIDSKTIKIDNGSGNGDFNLPIELTEGEYTIRAYTNFMRNFDDSCFFRKKINIGSETLVGSNNIINNGLKDKLHVSFFPEGGNIVNGILNNIGFKAMHRDGKAPNVSGSIVDGTGKTIQTFKASELGYGMFYFIPQKGKLYKASVLYEGQNYSFELPPSIDHGTLMRVYESNDFFRIIVYSSMHNSSNNLKLIGLQKGEMVCQTELNEPKPEIAVDIPKSYLTQGLVEFRVLDKNDVVLNKALAFFNNPKEKAMIKTSKNVYDRNDIVEVGIDLSEILPKNEIANMSVSVIETPSFNNANHSSNIRSHLLLNSELTEQKKPGYSISSTNFENKEDLTVLLRSQDINQDLFKNNIEGDSLKFSPESGFSLKGTVKTSKKLIPVKTRVTMSYKNSKDIGYEKTITDSLGRFNFKGLNFEERTFISIKAKSMDDKKYGSDFTIVLDSVIPPPVYMKRIPEKSSDKDYVAIKPKTIPYADIAFAPRDGEIELDEVKLTATKKRLERYTEKRKSALYTEIHHTLDVKNSNIIALNPLDALQGRFPGVDVIGDYIIIRGMRYHVEDIAQPLFLVDGSPSSRDSFTSVPLQDIDFIDIIKNTQTTIYGSRGGNHVIALYTLDGSEKNDQTNNRNRGLSFYHPGYYQARKFYPDKGNPTTLYWNPDLKLEQSNNSQITFKTANKSATYKVLLEGITSLGTPFTAETYFEVN